jgi:seryl-tRNA synthetase
MLDIAFIRDHSNIVKEAIKNKGLKDDSVVDELISVDEEWRSLTHSTDQLRNESNVKSKQIGQLMGQGKKEEAQKIIAETSEAKSTIQKNEKRLEELTEKRASLLFQIPNVPHETVPVGFKEDENETVKQVGEILEKEWRLPHWELVEEKKWIDFDAGSKVAGAGFPFYKGPLARLQRALINFFLERGSKAGYTEIQPPYFVNEDSARGTGQIPDKEDMMYTIPRDGFFAIPTGEVPVTNLHRDEIFEVKDLPVKYVAYTPCWRREAGSYGKDVRGLNRLHQFDKVELVKFVKPEDSYDELESLTQDAMNLLDDLGLSYRVLLMCTGDMGFTQSKKYDLEVWSPAQERWLEVSSCSNFEGFQARRMMIRYRNEDGKTETLHTLNGSGLALPRIVATLLETHQLASGNVKIPEALRPYLGGEEELKLV